MGSGAVEGVVLGLWKGGEVMVTGYTAGGGCATFCLGPGWTGWRSRTDQTDRTFGRNGTYEMIDLAGLETRSESERELERCS